ncbi:putative GABA permease [Myriangium duriaei CBS 260.36]|uniref:GABA permease n=1 Tax=Myriangium duriaei CBS 260.36 TaxID=1168546 RepID=A0A9P4J7E3_9PEZI|nr:putative GABA permease [Myriangium duriaei CBS 260.36]
MRRMGRVQEVRRVFRSYSLFSYTCIVMSTWEYLVFSLTAGLTNGGRGGLFWSYLIELALISLVTASLAEMASMAPTAGGQYHWVSEFGPPRFQKFLSYLTGWMSLLVWQTALSTSNFVSGTLLESLITIYRPDYELLPWRSTLMTLPSLVVLLVWTIFAHRCLPMLQNLTMVVHVMGCILIMFTIWVAAPHIPAKTVFEDFSSHGSYSNMFVVLMLGQSTPQWALSSMDAAAHMAEEVSDASRTVPRAMVYGLLLNGMLGLLMLITVLFALPDIDAALASPNGPFIYILQSAWSSTGYTYSIWILNIIILAGNIPFAATAARLVFALARDGGLPFPRVFSKIDQRLLVPVNAILVTFAFSFALGFIKVGSVTVYWAFASALGLAQWLTSCITIGCMLWRRVTAPGSLPQARWSLSRFGVPINAIALLFSLYSLFWTVWPSTIPLTIENFNFSGPLAVALIILCGVTYRVHGRKVYISPRERIKQD